MTRSATFLLVIWDGKSRGSKDNIIRGIKQNKKIKVIYKDRIISSPNIEISEIEKIYEENNGIGIMELKRRLIRELYKEDIPIQIFKKLKSMHSLYPTATKMFLKDQTAFDEYIVRHEYKGEVSFKYKPSIIEPLKNKILKMVDRQKENVLELFHN